MYWYFAFVIIAPLCIVTVAVLVVYCCYELEGGYIKDFSSNKNTMLEIENEGVQNKSQSLSTTPTLPPSEFIINQYCSPVPPAEPEYSPVISQPQYINELETTRNKEITPDADCFPIAHSESCSLSTGTSDSPDFQTNNFNRPTNTAPYVSPSRIPPPSSSVLHPSLTRIPHSSESPYSRTTQYKYELLHNPVKPYFKNEETIENQYTAAANRYLPSYRAQYRPSSNKPVTSNLQSKERPHSSGSHYHASAASQPSSARISYPPQMHVRNMPYSTGSDEEEFL